MEDSEVMSLLSASRALERSLRSLRLEDDETETSSDGSRDDESEILRFVLNGYRECERYRSLLTRVGRSSGSAMVTRMPLEGGTASTKEKDSSIVIKRRRRREQMEALERAENRLNALESRAMALRRRSETLGKRAETTNARGRATKRKAKRLLRLVEMIDDRPSEEEMAFQRDIRRLREETAQRWRPKVEILRRQASLLSSVLRDTPLGKTFMSEDKEDYCFETLSKTNELLDQCKRALDTRGAVT